jgi:hypothetical protein
MDELQSLPLVFNFDIRGFDIHATFVSRINRIYRGLPVLYNTFYLLLQICIELASNPIYMGRRLSERHLTTGS